MGPHERRRLKHWGWGFEDQQPSEDEVAATAAGAREQLGFAPEAVERPFPLADAELPAPRLDPPRSLAEVLSADVHDRASHAYGKSYRDVVRAFRGRFDTPPDLVAYPREEPEVAAVLDWCSGARAAAIPFGGGTSVVGGVQPDVGDGFAGAVSIDMRRLDRVLEVDPASRAALIQAGAVGPGLERQLRQHGLTLRHFPQSFEFSTLGGWIATRAGGHFATLQTHIDDLVESIRAVTPSGAWESRRLPGSGAGPSPDRLLLGSEGTLGLITEAWMRVRARPLWKASAGVRFQSFAEGAEGLRELVQADLWPSNCRLLDPAEAALTGAASDGALLVLGFESADHPLEAWMGRALECCADHGGAPREEPRFVGPAADGTTAARRGDGSAGAWRDAFLRAPYLRDTLVAGGVLSETFETAATWDRLPDLVTRVRAAAEAAVGEVCGQGAVTCRVTHAYPDGAAPYFTVLAPARRGSELEQWDHVKAAASEAILASGGTITHHHAVGRDHRRWYERQRPDAFAAALTAAKAAVDPAGMLNPGVLIDPVPVASPASL